MFQDIDIYATIQSPNWSAHQYTLTLENRGRKTVVNGAFDYSAALHPGNFGLDDTHMPKDIWIKSPVVFESLLPGQSITFDIEGYDLPSRFDGYKQQSGVLKSGYPVTETRVSIAMVLKQDLDDGASVARDKWKRDYEVRSARVDKLAGWERRLPWVALFIVLLLWVIQ